MTSRPSNGITPQDARPPRLRMSDAPAAIRQLVSRSGRIPTVIGVTGPVGSGKSTLASQLSSCVVPTDAYLPDYHTLPENERDLPEHADLNLLAAHIEQLRTRGSTRIPVWSFHTHRRESWRDVVRTDAPIVVEGIHAFEDRVLPHLDIAVFVEADPKTRWARWAAIESSGERGWGVEKAKAYFDTVAEPTFAARAHTYRARATVFVVND